MLAMGSSQSPLRSANTVPEELLGAAEVNETIRLLVQETSRGDAEEDADIEQTIQENVSQLQHQRQEASDHQADQENLCQAMRPSDAEAQRRASEASEYEKQLKRVMAQSLRKQGQRGSDSEWESDMGLDEEEDDEFDQTRGKFEKMAGKAAAVVGGSPGVQ
jgi:hypothetical protein